MAIVPKKLTAKVTHSTAMTMSSTQGSSAYSLPCVLPVTSATRGGDDEQLPAPEMELRQRVAEEARLQQPLHRVVGAAEDDVAAEREDDGVRVQRAEPAEGEVRRQVQRRHEEHGRDQDADEHADHGPDDGGEEEQPRGSVVVTNGVAHSNSCFDRTQRQASFHPPGGRFAAVIRTAGATGRRGAAEFCPRLGELPPAGATGLR